MSEPCQRNPAMNNEPEFKQPLLMWWMIWIALFSGIFVIYFVVGSSGAGAQAGSASPDSRVWMVGFAPFVISAVIRWLILPRAQNAQKAFSLFVVGLVLAEMPCILGVFGFPEHKLELFVLSVLGMLQFIPYFASRDFSSGE